MSEAERTHEVIESRLRSIVDPAKGGIVLYEADEGAFSVRLHRPDGSQIEVEVATGVWPDGLDDGEEARARAAAEWFATVPGDIDWLLSERVRLLALLIDAQAAMTEERVVPSLEDEPATERAVAAAEAAEQRRLTR